MRESCNKVLGLFGRPLFLLVAAVGLILSGCNSGASTNDPLQLTGPSSPPLTADQWRPYSGFSVSASGGVSPYTFSLNENWPTGITVGADDGVVGGTPTEAGTFTDLAVLLEDSSGTTVSFELGAELVVQPGIGSFRLEAGSAWWETQPPIDLSQYSELRMQFTFENISGADMVFIGDDGATGLRKDLQIWTRPDLAETPTLRFDAFPEGTYAPGAVFNWDVTLALSELTSPQTSIAIRPAQDPRGGVSPSDGWLALVNAELALWD